MTQPVTYEYWCRRCDTFTVRMVGDTRCRACRWPTGKHGTANDQIAVQIAARQAAITSMRTTVDAAVEAIGRPGVELINWAINQARKLHIPRR